MIAERWVPRLEHLSKYLERISWMAVFIVDTSNFKGVFASLSARINAVLDTKLRMYEWK